MSHINLISETWSNPIGLKSSVKPMSTAGLKDFSRDRTKEFMSTVESISQRRHHATSYSNYHQREQASLQQTSSPFGQAAIQIGCDLGITNLKLGKLSLLVKREGTPGDHVGEINQLRGIIKQDICALNRQLAQMQELVKRGRHDCVSEQQHSHLGTIVVTLQRKLANISTGFKTALEIEQKMQNTLVKPSTSHNYQQQSSRQNSQVQRSLTSSTKKIHGEDVSIDMGSFNSNSSDSGNVQNRFNGSQQQMFVVEEAEVRQRDNSMQSIEQTIVELGDIFTQLSYMVKEQEEITNRIDHNVDTTSFNIGEAHTQLVKYLKGVSGNRNFMIKVFVILLIFFILVVLFFT